MTSSQAPFATIDYREEDRAAVLVLLNIIHLKHRLIPKRLQFSILLQVAVRCEKYMCVELVQPWLSTWTDKLEFRTQYPIAEHVLFTHWVFGQEEEFEKVLKAMVLEVKLNKDGQLLNDNNWLRCEPFPAGIAENILRIRKETIENLLAIPHTKISNLEMSLAKTMPAMEHLGAALHVPIEQIYLSVDEVASAIESIHIYYFHTHHNCGNANFHQEVVRVLGRIENPVMDVHKRHMASQRAYMGFGDKSQLQVEVRRGLR
ncbi:hypothetical protein BKA65DRAFT_475866 [Rhexocercosporidium sp. MPI-PUGE-AT-0058]|nr:hypothetical protein BKA65DRAFT_475866 [Rhexocercosporidium sp. MPI-PUGE-AT-0058]